MRGIESLNLRGQALIIDISAIDMDFSNFNVQ